MEPQAFMDAASENQAIVELRYLLDKSNAPLPLLNPASSEWKPISDFISMHLPAQTPVPGAYTSHDTSPPPAKPNMSVPQTPTLPVALRSPVKFDFSPNGIEQQLIQQAVDSSWFQHDSEAMDVENALRTPSKFGPPRQLFQSPNASSSVPPTPQKPAEMEILSTPTKKASSPRSSKKRTRTPTPLSPTLQIAVEDMCMEPQSPVKRPTPLVLDTSTIDLTDVSGPTSVNTSFAAESDISTEIQLEAGRQVENGQAMTSSELKESKKPQDSQNQSQASRALSLSPTQPLYTPKQMPVQKISEMTSGTGAAQARRALVSMFAVLASQRSACRYEDMLNFSSANWTIDEDSVEAATTAFKSVFQWLCRKRFIVRKGKGHVLPSERVYQIDKLSPLYHYNDIIPEVWRIATGKNIVKFPHDFLLRSDLQSICTLDSTDNTYVLTLSTPASTQKDEDEARGVDQEMSGPTDAEIRDALNAALDSASKESLDAIQHQNDTSIMQETLPMPSTSETLPATLPLPPSLAPTVPLFPTSSAPNSPSNAPTQLLPESQLNQEHRHYSANDTQDANPTLPLPSSTYGDSITQLISKRVSEVEKLATRPEESSLENDATGPDTSILESATNGRPTTNDFAAAITSATQNVTHLADKVQYDDNPFLVQAAARFPTKSKDRSAKAALQASKQSPSTEKSKSSKTKSTPRQKAPTTVHHDVIELSDSTHEGDVSSPNPMDMDIATTRKSAETEQISEVPLPIAEASVGSIPLLSSSSKFLKSVISAPPPNETVDSLLRSAKQKRSFYSVSSSTTTSTHHNALNSSSSTHMVKSNAIRGTEAMEHELPFSQTPGNGSKRFYSKSTSASTLSHMLSANDSASQVGPQLTRHTSHGRDEFDRLHMSVHYSLVDAGYIDEDEDAILQREAGTLEFDPDVVPYSSAASVGPSSRNEASAPSHTSRADGEYYEAPNEARFEFGEDDNEFVRFGLNSQNPYARKSREVWTAIEDPDTEGISGTQRTRQNAMIDDIIESSQEMPSASLVPSIDDRDELDRSMEAADMPSQMRSTQQQSMDWDNFSSQLGAVPSSTTTSLRSRFKSPSQVNSSSLSAAPTSTQQGKRPLQNLQVSQNARLSAKSSKKGKRTSKNKKSVYMQENLAGSGDELEHISDEDTHHSSSHESSHHIRSGVQSSSHQEVHQQQMTGSGLDISLFDGEGNADRRMQLGEEVIDDFGVLEDRTTRPSSAATYSPYELVANLKNSTSAAASASHSRTASPSSPFQQHQINQNDRAIAASSPYASGSSRSFLKPDASRLQPAFVSSPTYPLPQSTHVAPQSAHHKTNAILAPTPGTIEWISHFAPAEPLSPISHASGSLQSATSSTTVSLEPYSHGIEGEAVALKTVLVGPPVLSSDGSRFCVVLAYVLTDFKMKPNSEGDLIDLTDAMFTAPLAFTILRISTETEEYLHSIVAGQLIGCLTHQSYKYQQGRPVLWPYHLSASHAPILASYVIMDKDWHIIDNVKSIDGLPDHELLADMVDAISTHFRPEEPKPASTPVPSPQITSSSTSNHSSTMSSKITRSVAPITQHRAPFKLPTSAVGQATVPALQASFSGAHANAPPTFARSRTQAHHHTFISPLGFSGGSLERGMRATILAAFTLPFTTVNRVRSASSASVSIRDIKRNYSQAVADIEAAALAKKAMFSKRSTQKKFELSSVLANSDATQSVALKEAKGTSAHRKRALALLSSSNRLVWIDLEPFADEIHPGQVITLKSCRFVSSSSISSMPLRTLLEDALSTLGLPMELGSSCIHGAAKFRFPAQLLQAFQSNNPIEYFPSSQESDHHMEVDAQANTTDGSATQNTPNFAHSKWAMDPCSLPILAIDRYDDRAAVSFRDRDDYTLPVCQDWSHFSVPRRASVFALVVASTPSNPSASLPTLTTNTVQRSLEVFGSPSEFTLRIPSFNAALFDDSMPMLFDHLLQDSPTSFTIDGFTHITRYDDGKNSHRKGKNLHRSVPSSNMHLPLERSSTASSWLPSTMYCVPNGMVKYKKPNSTTLCRETLAHIIESLQQLPPL